MSGTDNDGQSVSLKEYVCLRFDELDRRDDNRSKELERRFRDLAEAISKLTGAIISREVFDELSKDVADHDDEITDLSNRVAKLENSATIMKIGLMATWSILGPLIINWLTNYLGG